LWGARSVARRRHIAPACVAGAHTASSAMHPSNPCSDTAVKLVHARTRHTQPFAWPATCSPTLYASHRVSPRPSPSPHPYLQLRRHHLGAESRVARTATVPTSRHCGLDTPNADSTASSISRHEQSPAEEGRSTCASKGLAALNGRPRRAVVSPTGRVARGTPQPSPRCLARRAHQRCTSSRST